MKTRQLPGPRETFRSLVYPHLTTMVPNLWGRLFRQHLKTTTVVHPCDSAGMPVTAVRPAGDLPRNVLLDLSRRGIT